VVISQQQQLIAAAASALPQSTINFTFGSWLQQAGLCELYMQREAVQYGVWKTGNACTRHSSILSSVAIRCDIN